MGVTNLWKTVSKAGEAASLQMYLTTMRIQRLDRPESIRVGVDISPLMAACTAATLAGGIHGQFPGGALYIFFLKLAAFLKCPATFIFVFDGPGRPLYKRGHEVRHTSLHWEHLARILIGYFGFTAPAEAEAELAEMNRRGLIDAVMTSDNDALVFGAITVFRMLSSASKGTFDDEVTVFQSNSVNSLGLPHEELLLYALLCGGDYDSGIQGCGSATAYRLCQRGFGMQLLHGVNTYTGQPLNTFLANWRIGLENNSGRSVSIPDTFPDLHILRLYTHPITSWSTMPPTLPNSHSWFAREPCLWGLTQFCHNHFEWTTEDDLKKHFSTLIWPGAVMQMMYSPLLLYDSTNQVLRTPTTSAVVLKNRNLVRQGRYGKASGIVEPQPRVTVSAANIISLMDQHFKVDEASTITIWIPEAFLPNEMKRGAKLMKHKKRVGERKPQKSVQQQPERAINWMEFVNSTGDNDMVASGSGSVHPVQQSQQPDPASRLGFIDFTHFTRDTINNGNEDNSDGDDNPLASGSGSRWLGFLDLTQETTSDEDEGDGDDGPLSSSVQQPKPASRWLGFIDLTQETTTDEDDGDGDSDDDDDDVTVCGVAYDEVIDLTNESD